jgi:hypothetical protein
MRCEVPQVQLVIFVCDPGHKRNSNREQAHVTLTDTDQLEHVR